MKGKRIKGFPEYTVTPGGRVFRRGHEVQSYDNGKGYRQVKLWKDGERVTRNVHRLVLGEPANRDVDHRDNDRSNNRKSNLRAVSHSENIKKTYRRREK